MKNTILIVLATLAFSAPAASVNWTLSTGGSANYMVGLNNEKLTGTAYLLLTSDLVDFTSETAIQEASLGSVEISGGVNKETQTATSSKLTAPTEYSFTVLIFDSASSSYFTSAESKTLAAYNLGADQDHYGTPTEMSFTAKNLYATSALRNTQTWTAVPEPSTAALALAGLALLLKRRKA